MRLAFDVLAKHLSLGHTELLLGETRTGAAEQNTSTGTSIIIRFWSQRGKDLCVRQCWDQGSHELFNNKLRERYPFSPLLGDLAVGRRRRVRGRHQARAKEFYKLLLLLSIKKPKAMTTSLLVYTNGCFVQG